LNCHFFNIIIILIVLLLILSVFSLFFIDGDVVVSPFSIIVPSLIVLQPQTAVRGFRKHVLRLH